ncbi:Palmitoyltransferase zdhhc14 [Haplosporangium sp. Z 11]|nr:Palmitoyltransferase zdhhc14 [Haplosporangium sp. Z 11]
MLASFFSLPSSPAERGISFEQMLMANSAVAAQESAVRDHPLSTRPRSAARSPKLGQETTETTTEQPGSGLPDTKDITSVVHDNHNSPLSSTSGYTSPPDSDPASIKTILSVAGHIPGTNLEDMEEECLDYRLKGRSRVSRGYSADFSTSHWTAGSNHSSPALEGMFGDRGSMDAARRSMSKSRSPALSQPSSPKMNNSHSSDMLPLSEFLSQPVDDIHINLQPSASTSRRMNSAAANSNYPRYSPPPTTPPPTLLLSNQTGRVPITTAAGEFSGFQQYTPRYRDAKDGGHSRMSSHERPMTNGIGHLQETQLPSADSGMAGNGQEHDEDEYLTQGKPIRNYKIFPGRNLFFCGGRVMTSRDFPAFIMAIMLILTPTGLFFGFTSPYLWRRLSPAAPIVHAYLFIIVFSSMLKTSWTDPGVIPRGIDGDPPVDPPLELDPTSASFYPPRNLPRQKEVQIGNYTVRLKYCDTCKIYRPPRCSHCRQCDNCVEDEDHHCIWLNNCIGRRNYRYFLIFVTTASVYAFLTSALSLTHLLVLYHDRKDAAENPNSVSFQNDALAKAPVSALLMIYALIMGLAVGSLATYHFWLATKNRTTHEQLTSSMMRPHIIDNPFDRGSILGNCAAVLCRPPTRSYIRRRDYTVA